VLSKGCVAISITVVSGIVLKHVSEISQTLVFIAYLLIKYIKSVLWRVAKCLSYIEEARCLKVKRK